MHCCDTKIKIHNILYHVHTHRKGNNYNPTWLVLYVGDDYTKKTLKFEGKYKLIFQRLQFKNTVFNQMATVLSAPSMRSTHCGLPGVKPLPEPTTTYCQLDARNKFPWIKIETFSLKKVSLKLSSAIWRPLSSSISCLWFIIVCADQVIIPCIVN